MTPERLAEIERMSAWSQLAPAVPELLAEVRRLQSLVSRLANAERDLAETNLVLEQQDRDLERLRVGLREACDEIESTVISETQFDRHDDDPAWKLTVRLRTLISER